MSSVIKAGRFGKVYQSAPLAIVKSGNFTLSHGLGVVPELVVPVLECLSDNSGYLAGEFLVPGLVNANTSSEPKVSGLGLAATDTVINGGFGEDTYPIWAVNRVTGRRGSLDPASWQLIIRAYA